MNRRDRSTIDSELVGMLQHLLGIGHPAARFGDPAWQPHVDLVVSPSSVWIRFETPGVAAEELRIAVKPTAVEVSGTRRLPHRERGADYVRAEIVFGAFHRRVDLPFEVDAHDMEQRYEHGVLELRLIRSSAGRRRLP